MNVQGMDVAQVRQMAQQLSEAAQQVSTWQTQLSGEVNGLDWHGDDATTFRSSWESEVVAAFQDVERLLSELSETALRNADEQANASDQ